MAVEYIPFFFLAIFIGFLFLWFGLLYFFNKKSKMSKKLDLDKITIKRISNWGTGIVNGISFKNCLRVIETENDYIFETKQIFGGKALLLKKEELEIGPLVTKSFLKPKKITITSSDHSVSLSGNLADEIISQNSKP